MTKARYNAFDNCPGDKVAVTEKEILEDKKMTDLVTSAVDNIEKVVEFLSWP